MWTPYIDESLCKSGGRVSFNRHNHRNVTVRHPLRFALGGPCRAHTIRRQACVTRGDSVAREVCGTSCSQPPPVDQNMTPGAGSSDDAGRRCVRWRSQTPQERQVALTDAAGASGGAHRCRRSVRWRSQTPQERQVALIDAAGASGGAHRCVSATASSRAAPVSRKPAVCDAAPS